MANAGIDRAVEEAAIRVAHDYAVANGYASDDRRAAALVLVGLAIAAAAGEDARAALVRGYLRDLPDSTAAVVAWARWLNAAAAEGVTQARTAAASSRPPSRLPDPGASATQCPSCRHWGVHTSACLSRGRD